jgi:hypothetical protein
MTIATTNEFGFKSHVVINEALAEFDSRIERYVSKGGVVEGSRIDSSTGQDLLICDIDVMGNGKHEVEVYLNKSTYLVWCEWH